MRIIAGTAKGRRLTAPRGTTTRPLTDRMRESLFSSLGGAVPGARVLDLYAGTGAFGLEALSRGAAEATFVERDREAVKVLRRNVAAVGLGGSIRQGDVAVVVASLGGDFDLVMCDPPYRLDSTVLEAVLASVGTVLADDGVVLVHRRRDQEETPTPGTLSLTERRRHGDAVIWWYTKEGK